MYVGIYLMLDQLTYKILVYLPHHPLIPGGWDVSRDKFSQTAVSAELDRLS